MKLTSQEMERKIYITQGEINTYEKMLKDIKLPLSKLKNKYRKLLDNIKSK